MVARNDPRRWTQRVPPDHEKHIEALNEATKVVRVARKYWQDMAAIRIERIISAYQAGWSTRRIAEHADISRQRVAKIIRNAGLNETPEEPE